MNLGGTIHITKTGFCILLGSVIILVIYLVPSKHSDVTIPNGQINLNQLLSVAIQAAENGGKIVVNLQADMKISIKGKTKEGANESVTMADLKSHCVMNDNIKSIFPTLDIVSEEKDVACDKLPEHRINLTLVNIANEWVNEQDVKVWIDPLDATQEYTEKLTDYVTTMVCVAIKGNPVIGVIHKPFTKTTVWGWVGKGHSTTLMPVSSTKTKHKFIVSRSHTGNVKETIQKMFNENVVEVVTAGGAGYKVLEIINGNADVYLHVTDIKKWDICAGNAILNAVGGKMTTLNGDEIDYANSNDAHNEHGLIATLQSLKIDYNR